MPDWWNVLIAAAAPVVFLTSAMLAGRYLEREGQRERARARESSAEQTRGETVLPLYLRDAQDAVDRANARLDRWEGKRP